MPLYAGGPSSRRGKSVAGATARWSARSVIPIASARLELAAASGWNHFHLHRAERAIALGVSRIISQRVLVSDIVSHLLADAAHVFHIFRKVRETARGFGNFLKRSLGAFRALLALFALLTDGINVRIRLLYLVRS